MEKHSLARMIGAPPGCVGYDDGGQLTVAVPVADKGYDPVFGARPLKRFLQRRLETRLARALIAGEVNEGETVTFAVKGDELALVHDHRNATAA